MKSRRILRFASSMLALSLMLAACAETPTPATEATGQLADESGSSTPSPPKVPTPNLPTATLPGEPAAEAGRYQNFDLGISFRYPPAWDATLDEDESTLARLIDVLNGVVVVVFHSPMPSDADLEEAARQMRDAVATGVSDVAPLDDAAITLDDGRDAWRSEFSAALEDGTPVKAIVVSTARGGRLVSLLAFGQPDSLDRDREVVEQIAGSIALEAPRAFGVPRELSLFRLGGESSNPRVYDPAVSGGNDLVFSGLVSFNPQLEIVPDLAEGWDVSDDGSVYTFHLRPYARFHDGRPVTAHDVIYSWERAADPATDSDTVLTYLGDIIGVQAKLDGEAGSVSGLKAIDDHTLQVTLDAPKPYFLMKLAYGTAAVVDRANVESGPEWYRTPNGTGPYKLIRWDRFKLQLYERNDDFYLDPPAIRYIVTQLFAGVGIRMYETGEIDITGVSLFDAGRVRDPDEPLNADLIEGVGMCTSYVTFDASQPPFDDPKVRQAFAHAVDKQRYIDVALRGESIPARGLYPPALPGHNLELAGLDYDPELARQRLAESRYGGVENLPPIVFTSGGYGSSVDSDVAALIDMWQNNLGVAIQVENLDPNKYSDELHDGNHGQLFSYGWCADYPDPENFADALFHSGAQQNLGHYSNPGFDALVEAARVERDVDTRIRMYQEAEQILVEDAAAIFLNHHLSFVLVKPYVKGYVLTPIAVPIERYLSIDESLLGRE
jgi:oligopeptide transport system substrate-binding protein